MGFSLKARVYLMEKMCPDLGVERLDLGIVLQVTSLSYWETFLGPGTGEKLDVISKCS